MPRYYFDVTNGHGLERDETGVELKTADDVRRQVARIVTDIASEELPDQSDKHSRLSTSGSTECRSSHRSWAWSIRAFPRYLSTF